MQVRVGREFPEHPIPGLRLGETHFVEFELLMSGWLWLGEYFPVQGFCWFLEVKQDFGVCRDQSLPLDKRAELEFEREIKAKMVLELNLKLVLSLKLDQELDLAQALELELKLDSTLEFVVGQNPMIKLEN